MCVRSGVHVGMDEGVGWRWPTKETNFGARQSATI